MDEFEIDGSKVLDFPSFIDEVNRKFICRIDDSGKWTGNWDSFNDYLAWPDGKYRFTIGNSDQVKKALSAKRPDGQIPWTVLLDTFAHNSDYVELLLK